MGDLKGTLFSSKRPKEMIGPEQFTPPAMGFAERLISNP